MACPGIGGAFTPLPKASLFNPPDDVSRQDGLDREGAAPIGLKVNTFGVKSRP